MNRALPSYASEFIDNRGKARIRLRRAGWQTIYVHAQPGSVEFTERYHDWLANGKLAAADKAAPGSFDDLISRFYRSKDWSDLKPVTQYTYRGELERFRAKYGERTVATMTAQHIDTLMKRMAETPSAANNLRKRLGRLFDYAARIGWRGDNPVRAVRGIRVRTGGYQTWQEEQIAQFEAYHPVGTMARLAFDLAIYTAQRKSDVRVMGPQHVENGKLRVRQFKTGKALLLPIDQRLSQSIAATRTGHLAFIVSAKGAPFTLDSFGMWFMRQCRAAGLTGYSMHGLRKAASRRMAEMGLSNQLIKSITGHTTDSEVSRYTRDAEQALMAEQAGVVMASRGMPVLASNPERIDSAG